MTVKLFAVRIHRLMRIESDAFRHVPPYHVRVEPITGEARGETGGEAVRTFCTLMNITPDAGFSFEEIKGK